MVFYLSIFKEGSSSSHYIDNARSSRNDSPVRAGQVQEEEDNWLAAVEEGNHESLHHWDTELRYSQLVS